MKTNKQKSVNRAPQSQPAAAAKRAAKPAAAVKMATPAAMARPSAARSSLNYANISEPRLSSHNLERLVTGIHTTRTSKEERPLQDISPVKADNGWAKRAMPESSSSHPTLAESKPPEIRHELSRNDIGESMPALELSPVTPAHAVTPQSELLGAAQIPLSGDAAAYMVRIDNNSNTNIRLVRAEAKAKHLLVRAFFARQRQAVAGFVGNNSRILADFFNRKQTVATAWIMSRAATVQSFVLSLMATAITIGANIAASIRSVTAALTGGMTAAVNAIINVVLNVARSIPIPDIPGLGAVRRVVLNAADRIAAVIRRAIGNVQRFIDLAVGSILSALQVILARIATSIVNVVTRLVAVITRAIAWINRQLTALQERIISTLHQIGLRVDAILVRMDAVISARIDRAEAQACAEIEDNRRQGVEAVVQIMEFCYAQGDNPSEEATDDPLNVVDNTSSKEQFESSARTALRLAALQVILRNAATLLRFRHETSGFITLIVGAIRDFAGNLQARVRRVFQEIYGGVAQAIAQLFQKVATIASRISASIRAMIARASSLLGSLVTVIIGVIRSPLNTLTNAVRSIIAVVRGFFQGIITRLIRLFSSDSGQSGSAGNASTITDIFDQFTPERLAASARMASPPAAAAVVLLAIAAAIAEAAAATAAIILEILFWVGVVLLIIAVIILIVLIVMWIIGKVRTMPRARPRTRTRPRARRRRSIRRPLRWNPSMTYGAVVASGGMPGTLDTTARLPARAPLHGHHVWPQYVGGPSVQPLMSIRDTVHISFIHPSLHLVMKGTAVAMGQDITTSTTSPKNVAFIAHIKGNMGHRLLFAGVVTSYYAGLNAVTHPAIPAPAYLRGISHSFPRI